MQRTQFQSLYYMGLSLFLGKISNILCRIYLSHKLSSFSFSLYLYFLPTFSLCMSLCLLSIPNALFKLVASKQYQNKNLILTSFYMLLLSNFILCTIIILFHKPIALFLGYDHLSKVLLTLILFIPISSLNAIAKNYYLGIKKYRYLFFLSLIEEISRLFFTIFIIYVPDTYQLPYIFIAMSLSELITFIVTYCKLPKTFHFVCLKTELIKPIFEVALPITGSRLLHSFVSFIEPILLLYLYQKIHLTNYQCTMDYSIISQQLLGLLLMPTFLTTIIFRYYLPLFLEHIKNSKKIIHLLKQALLLSIIIALPFTLCFICFPETLFKIFYNHTQYSNLLPKLAIPFLLFYIQPPITALLQAYNLNKTILIIHIIECILELILLYLLTPKYTYHAIYITFFIGLLFTLISSISLVIYRLRKVSPFQSYNKEPLNNHHNGISLTL